MKKILFTIIVFLTIPSAIAQVSGKQPNVVIIFVDDMGYADIGPYGSKVATPHLDSLAAEGIKLTEFYVAQPVCTASRAALLTGTYPNRIGVHKAFFPGQEVGLNPQEETLAELLREEGYRTALFGKWHLGHLPDFLPTRQGFDEFYGIPYSNDMWPGHPQQEHFNFDPLPLFEGEKIVDSVGEAEQKALTTLLTERAVAFINENRERPFFLYLAHPQPHVPLFVSEKFRGKSGHGLYGDVIQELDWSVGEVVQALRKNGLEENTLVIFTSDNGPWLPYGNHAGSAAPFREGKGTTFEGGVRVPFIAKYPPLFPKGRTIETAVMAIDLLPSISALTGAKLPELEIDGKNALPVFSGKSIASPQEAYYFYYNVNELHAVRYGDWKMYFPHSYGSVTSQDAGQGGLPGAITPGKITSPELYLLKKDPQEINNLIDEFPEIAAKIQALAEEKRKELGDALKGIEGKENRPVGSLAWDKSPEHNGKSSEQD